jgi:hypothetical protein
MSLPLTASMDVTHDIRAQRVPPCTDESASALRVLLTALVVALFGAFHATDASSLVVLWLFE